MTFESVICQEKLYHAEKERGKKREKKKQRQDKITLHGIHGMLKHHDAEKYLGSYCGKLNSETMGTRVSVSSDRLMQETVSFWFTSLDKVGCIETY